jgi:3-hydroxyacyl-[acyl-carrier-protein] dehydratase
MSFLDGLFTVVHMDGECCEVTLASAEHPVFLAHFESNPILPGFLHIDMAAFLFGLDVHEVKKAKYFEIVRPCEKLTLKCAKKGDDSYGIEVKNAEGKSVSKLELCASKATE